MTAVLRHDSGPAHFATLRIWTAIMHFLSRLGVSPVNTSGLSACQPASTLELLMVLGTRGTDFGRPTTLRSETPLQTALAADAVEFQVPAPTGRPIPLTPNFLQFVADIRSLRNEGLATAAPQTPLAAFGGVPPPPLSAAHTVPRPPELCLIPDFDNCYPIFARMLQIVPEITVSEGELPSTIDGADHTMTEPAAPDPEGDEAVPADVEGDRAEASSLLERQVRVVRGGSRIAEPHEKDKTLLRAIATPCRSRREAQLPGQHSASPTGPVGPAERQADIRRLSLVDLVPLPVSGVCFGVDRDILADLLHPYACHGFSHSLPSWPGLDADSRRVMDSLAPFDPDAPLDCMFLYTDGSFVEHTHTAAWAVVVLGAQQDCFCLIGVLGNTCCEGRVDRHAYEGEIEAILHARAVALAAAPTPCHIVSDCTSAIAAAGGCTRVLPTDDVTKGAVGLAFASFAFGQPIIAHHTYSHVGCPFNDTADWIAKGCARGMMLPSTNTGAADLVQAARLGLLQNLWLTAPDGFAQTQLPYLNQQGAWAAAAAFQEPCTRPTLPEALQPWLAGGGLTTASFDAASSTVQLPLPEGLGSIGPNCQEPCN